MIDTVIGSYRVVARIGGGGMGEVYRAVDTLLGREVAIKVLHRHLMQEAGRLDRFRAEAITLARLNHPNIALLYNLLEENGETYMVMEYVDGETLESLLQRQGALPVRRALELFIQVLQGLEHAHARQVIHRDIKPGNILLTCGGGVKITDFGIARVLGASRLTQAGGMIGTPEYMSPEQIQGQEQDARSDIYAAGILLYEMVTGCVPFSSTSEYEVLRAHLEAEPPAPRRLVPGLPAAVERAIRTALAKDP